LVSKPFIQILIFPLFFFPAGDHFTEWIEVKQTLPLWGDIRHKKPAFVKGIHLGPDILGNKTKRKKIEKLFAETELNTAVITIKDKRGFVYLPGIKLDGKFDVYKNSMPAIEKDLTFLKERGIYTVGRIVVFEDSLLAKYKPAWAVKSSNPMPKAIAGGFRQDIWVDDNGFAWADPFVEAVWNYNVTVASIAAQLGFQEIQFDYIRFPSDGKMEQARFSKPISASARVKTLASFLKRAQHQLKPLGVDLSIDVFGLAGSRSDDLWVGHQLSSLIPYIDVVSPMMYPSHYPNGVYGLKKPIEEPYRTVWRCAHDTLKKLKNTNVELRPYLQDFSNFSLTE